MNPAPLRGGAASAAAAFVLLAASLRALWQARDYGLLGLDSLPLVLATRADSLGELVRGLARPLFGELLPAPYYRPVLHLSIALDQANFGLEPFGYHVTSVVVFAICALALHLLARRLGFGAVGAFTALAFFCLHPVQGVVLPAPARRADGLCLLFTLLAVVAQLRATNQGRTFATLPAVLSLLAIGAKETGFAAPALCALAAVMYPAPGASRARALGTALGPLFIAIFVATALRFAVLGSFTGGRPVLAEGWLGGTAAMLFRVVAQSLSARAVWPDAPFPILALGATLAIGVGAFTLAPPETRQRMREAFIRPALFALGVLVTLGAGYALGMVLQPWYLLMPVAGAGLLLGAAVHALDVALLEPQLERRARTVARLACLCAALFVAQLAIRSPLVRNLGDWDRADARRSRYFAAAATQLSAARSGEQTLLPPPPAFVGGKPRMAGVVVLAPYTVEAWARLHFPDVRVQVAGIDAEGASTASAHGNRPNIVLIVADDLGYADLGFQGSTEIASPNLDRLAAEGVRFTDAYVSAPLCAPTRAGLLTGRDANRFGYTSATGSFQDQMRRDVGVPLEETLLPEVLHAAGYATAAVGKWHLGVRPKYRPLQRGFESFFGILAGTHAYFDWGPGIFGPVFRGNERARGDEYLTDAFAREAEAFLGDAHDRPFFLYVAFHAVHGPLEAPERHLARYAHLAPEERRQVAAMTSALDDGVGRILDALANTGRDRDTLVFFLNDNGGVEPISSNAPLRSGKASLFEGGIRVPLLMRWPDRIPPGVYSHPVSSLDVFPTALAAAGLPARADVSHVGHVGLDGVDLLPHLLEAGRTPPHDVLRWRFAGGGAIRRENWKLLRAPGTRDALFDLGSDVGETRDVASEHPKVAQALARELDVWQASLPEATAGSPAPEGSLESPGRGP